MQTALVVPFRNEGDRVLEAARSAQESLSQGVVDMAFFVNDHSEPGSWEALETFDGITLAHNNRDYSGKAWALDVGVGKAEEEGCDWFVLRDADMRGVTPDIIQQLLSPLEAGAIMSIGYIGIRRHFANLPLPFNWFGALSGLRAIKMEAWHTLSDGWFEGRSDKNGFNEAVLNGRVAKLKQPIVGVALSGVSHASKYSKTGSLTRAALEYAQTYIHAARAAMWVAVEPDDNVLGITDDGDERSTNADQFIRAAGAHRKLRNVWAGAALSGATLITAINTGELPKSTKLELFAGLLSSMGIVVGTCNELRQLEYGLRAKALLDAK